METLILNNGTKKDLNLLLDIAQKLGLNLTVEKQNNRYEKLRKLAKNCKKIGKIAKKLGIIARNCKKLREKGV